LKTSKYFKFKKNAKRYLKKHKSTVVKITLRNVSKKYYKERTLKRKGQVVENEKELSV